MIRRLLSVPLLVAALLLTGCGSERTAADVQKKDAGSAATATAGAKDGAAGVQAVVAAAGTDLKAAPKLARTSGAPPSMLVARDVVTGTGKTAKLGDQVKVRYSLAVWGGDKVESSWDKGTDPVAFPLKEGGLIEGWIKGIPGMKVGGRRVLVVPPDLGYGPQGNGPVPANATLVFVIDLVGTGSGGGSVGGG